MDVERATSADLPSIASLLIANGLVLEGAAEAFVTGVVVREEGEVVGAAAVESYGTHALLRSVVVRETERGGGVGRRLVAGAEALARMGGATDAYLLTETAVGYFPKLGYRPIDRGEIPGEVRESLEFTTACPDTAVAMVRALGPAHGDPSPDRSPATP